LGAHDFFDRRAILAGISLISFARDGDRIVCHIQALPKWFVAREGPLSLTSAIRAS
jgi:hypothetical protein